MNKFKIKIFCCLILTLSIQNRSIFSYNASFRPTEATNIFGKKIAKWTIALYMGGRNSLNSYAADNLQDMANAVTSNKINLVAQLDQPGKKGARRYSAKNGVVNLEDYSNVSNPTDIREKLVNFLKWVNLKYPSEKLVVIIWNHGSGAVSPKQGDPMRIFMQSRDLLANPTLTPKEFFQSCKVLSEIYSECQSETAIPKDVLFDDEYKTCLNNKDLRSAFLEITSQSVLGRKIDIIGFDACYMGATEVAYQLRDCADYMIGSPDLELAKGWDYTNWISKLNQSPNKSTSCIAKEIVLGFESLYKNKTQLFTQTAIDLSKIEEINENNLEITKSFEDAAKIFNKKLLNATLKARKSCVQYSTKFYIDQYSFYQSLLLKVLQEDGIAPANETIDEANLLLYDSSTLSSKKYHPTIINLFENIKKGLFILEKTIIKNCHSSLFSGSQGLSIYFPSNKNIDTSYFENEFATSSKWSSFLQNICSFMN